MGEESILGYGRKSADASKTPAAAAFVNGHHSRARRCCRGRVLGVRSLPWLRRCRFDLSSSFAFLSGKGRRWAAGGWAAHVCRSDGCR